MSFHKISSPGDANGGGGSFTCNECGQAFQTMSQLTKHGRVHGPSAEHYKYPCTLCGKKFTRPHHVNRHMLLHTGENPFKCTVCTAAFPRVESLRTHEAKGCGRMKAGQYEQNLADGLPVSGMAGAVVMDNGEDEEAPEEMIVEAGLMMAGDDEEGHD